MNNHGLLRPHLRRSLKARSLKIPHGLLQISSRMSAASGGYAMLNVSPEAERGRHQGKFAAQLCLFPLAY
jgi:hypothetical protein